MTDKQIIIDGVRVDECCYFDYENDGYEDSCYIHQNECSAQNCYYKQLKRKEQECEQKDKDIKYLIKCLDNSYKIKQDSEIYWERERKKLKAENEELKKKVYKYEQAEKYPAAFLWQDGLL